MSHTPHPTDSSGADAVEDQWSWPTLREAERKILLDILLHGSRSRAEAGRRAALPRASLSRTIHELLARGFLLETPAETAGPGRPSGTLRINPSGATFLGMKLTGDALYTVLSDLRGEVLHTEGEPLITREIPDVVALIARTGHRLMQQHPRMAAMGICLAGVVRQDPGQGAVVIDSAFLGWDEVPLQALLESSVGLPVTVSNDVHALTVGNHWFGPGLGADPLAVIALGVGMGLGITAGGQPMIGAHGRLGKISHLPVGRSSEQPSVRTCAAGHRDCISAYATVPSILRNANRDSMIEVIDAAGRRDPHAVDALHGAAEALGAMVAAVTNLIDPELIVITGESLEFVRAHREEVEAAARLRLDPESALPQLSMPAFAFTDYAWGASVTSLHATV